MRSLWPWVLVGAVAAVGYFGYTGQLGGFGDDPETADLRAVASPAAAAYERYATAMTERNFKGAAAVSVAAAREVARTRQRVMKSGPVNSPDKTYLSNAALEEMGRSTVDPEEPDVEISYDYDRLETIDSGKVVHLEALQTIRTESRTLQNRTVATVMEISGEWKVSEFQLLEGQ